MTKEELLQEIENLKKKVEELEDDKVFYPYPIKVKDEYFYLIDDTGLIDDVKHYFINRDYAHNKINPRKYAELRHMESYLQDRMWKFSYRHGWEDDCLKNTNPVYCIYYNSYEDRMYSKIDRYGIYFGNVYFSSKEIAEKAIKKFGDEIKELWKMRANIAKGEM